MMCFFLIVCGVITYVYRLIDKTVPEGLKLESV